MDELTHVVLQRSSTVLGEVFVVIVRCLRRSIAMNLNLGDGHIGVLLYHVDGVDNLRQLTRVVSVVGMQLGAVDGEVDKRSS